MIENEEITPNAVYEKWYYDESFDGRLYIKKGYNSWQSVGAVFRPKRRKTYDVWWDCHLVRQFVKTHEEAKNYLITLARLKGEI